ncbi:DNA polymerase III alpha subunit [Rhizobium tibeticum]|uniref:DNA polymerase III alpha subunit n=1 Tax=Rhizobium tibeticum TaxID=501024 RepID=A0A1H8PL38_9HYPH|nr:Error-prone DNA polymerase [Rhizobium tibeticum]SEO42253.1 DNA polymerase III alpha subunit [Rhizobium tibeticum]
MLRHFFVQMFVIAIVLGSAANAAVSYSPGITNDLLFERFVWQERDEAPGIDVDCEHEAPRGRDPMIHKPYTHQKAAFSVEGDGFGG